MLRAVRMELESMTSAVVDGMRFELIRGVLNIHLAFIKSVPTVHNSATIKLIC